MTRELPYLPIFIIILQEKRKEACLKYLYIKRQYIFFSIHFATWKGYFIIFSPITNQNYLLSISFLKTLTVRPQQRSKGPILHLYFSSLFLLFPVCFKIPVFTGRHWGEYRDVGGKFNVLHM